MAEALDHGIALSLFSRQGRYRGVLQPPVGKNVLLRMEQYRLYAEEAAALEAGRACLRAKLENSLAVLHRCRTRRPLEGSNQLVYEEGRGQTEEALQGLASVGSVPELLGYEGSGAKGYFAALMQFQRSEFEWPGRKKHPAPDPLNALLSLGYTLLMNELSALVQAHGIDPGLGFLHEIDGSRPSLALDLMEPFRAAMVDRFTLHYVNRRRCRAEDFEKRQNSEGLFLKPDELREYLAAYERWMLASVGALAEGKVVNFRSVLRGEVDRYIAFLGGRRKGVVWEPFVVRTLWQDGEGEAEGGEEGAVAG
jgi:CRISPR-associated protein Cas1